MNAGGEQGARLEAVTRELTERWRQTREVWRDAQAREFEGRFIQVLEASVANAARGMSELDAVLRRIRSDCE